MARANRSQSAPRRAKKAFVRLPIPLAVLACLAALGCGATEAAPDALEPTPSGSKVGAGVDCTGPNRRNPGSLLLFPEAFTMLVLGKAYHISKSAIVVAMEPSSSMTANAGFPDSLSFLSTRSRRP